MHKLFISYDSFVATWLTAGYVGLVARLIMAVIGCLHFASLVGGLLSVSVFAYAIISFCESGFYILSAIAMAVLNSFVHKDIEILKEESMYSDEVDANGVPLVSKRKTKELLYAKRAQANVVADSGNLLGLAFWAIFEMSLFAVIVWGNPAAGHPKFLHGSNTTAAGGPIYIYGTTTPGAANNWEIQNYIIVTVAHLLYVIKMLVFFLTWFLARDNANRLQQKLADIHVEASIKNRGGAGTSVHDSEVGSRVAIRGSASDSTQVPLKAFGGSTLNSYA